MKLFTTLICGCIISMAIPIMAAPTTLTFDSLPTPAQPPTEQQYAAIPNGYGGLQWNNFDVINVTSLQVQNNGYYTGLVSPNNVAFNLGGSSAGITSAPGFDLYSGYFTSAFQSSATIEVQGFRGSTEIYDNIYSLTDSGPTFINLDYLDVNAVDFVVSGGNFFVMDNLNVDVPDEAETLVLLAVSGGLCVLGVMAGRKMPRRFSFIPG
jgi:hypothetical protein